MAKRFRMAGKQIFFIVVLIYRGGDVDNLSGIVATGLAA